MSTSTGAVGLEMLVVEPIVTVSVDERHFTLEADDVVSVGATAALEGQKRADHSERHADRDDK